MRSPGVDRRATGARTGHTRSQLRFSTRHRCIIRITPRAFRRYTCIARKPAHLARYNLVVPAPSKACDIWSALPALVQWGLHMRAALPAGSRAQAGVGHGQAGGRRGVVARAGNTYGHLFR